MPDPNQNPEQQSKLFDALDDVGSDTDLFQLFRKDVEDMTDDELEQTFTRVQAQRRKKTPRTRRQTELDMALKKLEKANPAVHQQLLKKIEENIAAKKAQRAKEQKD